VEDQGVGFDAQAVIQSGNTRGLIGIHERTNLLGGELIVESTPGKGTRLTAELPIDSVLERRRIGARILLLVDDHPIFRQGLRLLLETEPEFTIVGEAGDGLEAVRLVERLHPEVVVIDLMMPVLNGLEVTRQVCSLTRVVILSMHANEAYVVEALQNGAYAYILKDSTAADLVEAIHTVMLGRRYLSPPLSERAIEAYIQKTHSSTLDPFDTLTTREREVFHLVAQGYSNNEVSEQLSISSRTVEIHRANLMRKLKLHNQTDLIRYAIKRGIIQLEE